MSDIEINMNIITESQFWDSGVVEKLTSLDGYGGMHSEQPYAEGGYLDAPDDEPEGEYVIRLQLQDEKYTFYHTKYQAQEEAYKIIRGLFIREELKNGR